MGNKSKKGTKQDVKNETTKVLVEMEVETYEDLKAAAQRNERSVAAEIRYRVKLDLAAAKEAA